MRSLGVILLSFCAIICLTTSLTWADPKVETTDISVNGKAVGCIAGAHIKHYVVLVQQGSRYIIYVDGAPGPKIESMDWTVAHFTDVNPYAQEFHYDLSPTGALTFIARTEGTLTKYVVTPDSNLDTILSTAKPAPAGAL